MAKLYKKSDWKEVDKGIKFEKVSAREYNDILSALYDSDNVYIPHQLQDKEKREERKQRVVDEVLSEIDPSVIRTLLVMLENRVNHLLTYKEEGSYYNARRVWRFAVEPFVKYSHRARWTELNRNSRPVAAVLKRWTRRIKQHWVNRDNVLEDLEKQRQSELVMGLRRRANDEANRQRHLLDSMTIRAKLINALGKFVTGDANSTNGDFSFSLHYCTRYVDEGMGLKEYDSDNISEGLKTQCKYDTLDDYHKGQADVYIEEIVDYEYAYYAASKRWLGVMKPAYDAVCNKEMRQ